MNKTVRYLLICLLGLTCFFQSPVAKAQTQDSLRLQQIDSLTQLTKNLQTELAELKSEPKKEKKKVPNFKVKFTGRGLATAGNIERILLEARMALSYSKPTSVIALDMNPRFAYGEQSGVLAERDYGTDFNIGIFDYKRVHGIIFGFAETSNLRQISFRGLGGAGVAWRIVKMPNYSLSISNAIMYETTDFQSDTKEDINITRNSTRLKGEYRFFNQKLICRHVVLFQPAINTDNLRWNGTLTLDLPLTAHFSVQTALDNSYESAVVEGRKNNDTRWTIGFTLANWSK